MTQQPLTKSPKKTQRHVERRETNLASTESFQRGLHPIVQLQRMLGNRSVAQLIQAKQLTPEGKIVGLQRQLNKPPVAPTPPAGTLPTRQQLNAEVDLMFREFFPDAPKQLNPNDPKQADLVDTWLGVRDGILNQWTDKVFFSFFPNAPKRLDPNNTDDAQLIEFWGDIRHQIRDGPPGKYHWGPQTSKPAPTTRRPRTPGKTTTPAAAPPPLRVVDIHNYGRGRFALDFETEPTVKAAAAKVFPDGMPPGVTISLYGPKQILFEHITMDSLKSMPSWLASAFSQAAQGIEDDPMQRAAPKQEPARQHGKPHPEIDIDTPEALHSWLESAAHKGHEIGAVAELVELLTKIGENIAYNRLVAQVGVDAAEGVAWAGAGLSKVAQFHRVAAIAEVIGVISKVLSVFGDVALIIWVAYQLIEAFKAEKEGELRFGYLYGVMWEALGESDHVRVYKNPGITYSAEELREAFVDGVAKGRKKGKELEIGNSIKLWVAAEAVHSGLGVWAAAHTVITEIYNKGQRHKSKWQLDWPTPFPYTGIVGMIAGE